MSHDRKPGRVRPVAVAGSGAPQAGATALTLDAGMAIPETAVRSGGQGLFHILLFFAGSAVGGVLMEMLYR